MVFKVSAVPPSNGVGNFQNGAHGAIDVIATHQLSNVCQQMYTVDATAIGTAPDCWQLADGWENASRLLPARSLKQEGGAWRGELSWTPRPGQPEVQGLVVCIVPDQPTYFPKTVELMLNGARDPHQTAIRTAFELSHQPARTFSAAVVRQPAK